LKKGFILIGLTGPLGSGCSTIAKFLSNDLKSYILQCKEELSKTESSIGEYYKYLKDIQTKANQYDEGLNEKKRNMFIRPQELLQNIMQYNDETFNREENIKELNRKLRQLLHHRDILNIFTNTEWSNFSCISMSTMIMKLVIENATDYTKNQTKDFERFCKENNINNEYKNEIIKYSNDYKEKMQQFNDIVMKKMWNRLDCSFCNDIDSMFKKFEELKTKMSQKIDNDTWLQNIGDNLRLSGNPFIRDNDSQRYEHLYTIAIEANKYLKYIENKSIDNNKFFVIDSFRNPMEVNYFRERYGSFYLCSVYARREIRNDRLISKYGKSLSIERDSRDSGEKNGIKGIYKQNVTDCVMLSDYSMNNETKDGEIKDLKGKIIRLLCLIEKPGCTQPTTDETFMNLAYTLSLRSTCISRNVGAIITNPDGFIIGAGWNDVGTGQIGCASRCIKDLNTISGEDSILSVWKEEYGKFVNNDLLKGYKENQYFCFKDLESQLKIYEKIDKLFKDFNLGERIKKIDNLNDDSGTKLSADAIDIIVKLNSDLKNHVKKNLKIKRLEYARALHAEENAILQVATNGGIGIKGGTIYTTTFPCELCAKKIYQSGLKRIVYTEPYPKSISENIFLKDGIRNIKVEQFEGVKSSSYYRLFKPTVDKKEMQFIDELY
jgi:deoxycytidylate deaminase